MPPHGLRWNRCPTLPDRRVVTPGAAAQGYALRAICQRVDKLELKIRVVTISLADNLRPA